VCLYLAALGSSQRASEASNAGQKGIEHFKGIFEGSTPIEDALLKGPKSLGLNVNELRACCAMWRRRLPLSRYQPRNRGPPHDESARGRPSRTAGVTSSLTASSSWSSLLRIPDVYWLTWAQQTGFSRSSFAGRCCSPGRPSCGPWQQC